MRCSKCNLKGDPIEVLSILKDTTDIPGLIYASARDGFCVIPPEELTPDCIESYLENFPNQRARINEVWEYMSAVMTTDHQRPELVQRIQRDHLWNGWNTKGQHRLARFLGAGHRRELMAKFSVGKQIPNRGFNTFLALNCQDIPGRSCAFFLMGEEETHLHYTRVTATRFDGTTGDGGLAFLDTLSGADQTVFATADYRTALQLHRKQLNQSETPLKLMIYNQATKRAWSYVTAEKVVFWNPEITLDVFKHARLVRNAFIATKPALTRRRPDEMHEYVCDQPISVIMGRMETSAVPWSRALAIWLTDPQRPELDIHAAFAQLGLNTEERELVLSECLPSDRDRLKAFLGQADARLRHVVINGWSFIERGNKWYHLHHDRREEVMSDTIFRLTRESLDPFSETAYWSGEIRHGEHRIPVEGVPLKEFQKDPGTWITKQMIKAGIKVPYFEKQSSFNSLFMGLVRKFSQYETVTMATKLGIMPDGSIMMPAFNIVNGKVSNADDVLVRLTPIASGVRPPIPRIRKSAPEEIFPTRVRWTLLAAAFVTNWMAEFRNAPLTPIAVTGDNATVAGEALEHFVKTSGMRRERLTSLNYNSIEHLVSTLRQHNYPVFVDMWGAKQIALWPPKIDGSIIAKMSPIEAAALGTNQPWIHIFGSSYRHDANVMPPFDDVLMYLTKLQKNKYHLDMTTTTFNAVLHDMCEFFGDYIPGIEPSKLYSEANRSYIHYQNAGDCFIELVAWLFHSGKLGMDSTEEDMPKLGINASLVHNAKVGWVYVSRDAVYAACRHIRCPLPDLYRVEQDLISRQCLVETGIERGIMIKQETWDTQLKFWKHRFQTPS